MELDKAIAIRKASQNLRPRLEWLKQRASGSSVSALPEDAHFSGSTRDLYASPEGDNILAAYSSERSAGLDAVGHQPTAPEVLYKLADAHQGLSLLASLWVLRPAPIRIAHTNSAAGP